MPLVHHQVWFVCPNLVKFIINVNNILMYAICIDVNGIIKKFSENAGVHGPHRPWWGQGAMPPRRN